jgi:alkyl hydroperoxide reductase subunit AhpC
MVLVGKKAPDFTTDAVVNKEFKKITLSSYNGKNG